METMRTKYFIKYFSILNYSSVLLFFPIIFSKFFVITDRETMGFVSDSLEAIFVSLKIRLYFFLISSFRPTYVKRNFDW